MNDFTQTSHDISVLLDCLADIIEYPLADNKGILDYLISAYERSLDFRCGFTSDLSRNSSASAIKSLASYLLEPTSDNFVNLQRKLLEYEVKFSVNAKELSS